MVLGGRQRYESVQDQDTPTPATAPASGAWANLARRESDQSSNRDEFELDSVTDRSALTRLVSPSPDNSQDLDAGRFLHPPTAESIVSLSPASGKRRLGRARNPSSTSTAGSSSLHPGSTRSSSNTNARLASVKQVLGRASTRVMNLSGSSRSHPTANDTTSVYSTRSVDGVRRVEGKDELDDNDGNNPPGVGRHSNTDLSMNTPPSPWPTSDLSLSSGPLVVAGTQPTIPIVEQPPPDPPLEGKSLLIFGPDNGFRQAVNRFLNQIIEVGSRIVVSGLILYPKDGERIRKYFGKPERTDNLHDTNPTILRKTPNGQKRQSTMAPSATFKQTEAALPIHNTPAGRATTIIDFAVGRQTTFAQHIPTYMDPLIAYKPQFVAPSVAQIPFLRHTFNRIDFIAVICYWIDFSLMVAGVENIYFFKTIAAMRTLRLLNITAGSSTILHSLKKSAPLLVNIALFIAFFFVIFSIVGVQAFKGSFSRRCVLASNYTESVDQFCGGHYNTSAPRGLSPYLNADNSSSPTSPKGHICSAGFVCKDTGASFEDALSFDAIYSSMVPVYVLMTGQTWTDMMYSTMDAEYAWSSIYFVLVVLVMNFWILNLFIAVINEMFAKIRDDSTQNSAFTSGKTENKTEILRDSVNNFTYGVNTILTNRANWVNSLECIWVLAVVADLVFQCLPQYNSPVEFLAKLDRIELWFTVAFAVDIIVRFLAYLPQPKDFFVSKKNMVDLFLAIATLVIQIPPIHNSRAYVYLTVFQVLRIYRPIIYVERLRSLIRRVVGSWIGLLNLIFFIAMFLGVVSVMAGLLFREIVDEQTSMNFSDFYVSYLGMYQLFSGENWTDILYSVMSAEIKWNQVVIATVFIIAFYSFANFVLVNMLIAIIMENFEGGAEVAKHAQQILDFASKAGYSKEQERKYVIYLTKYLKPYPKSIGVDNLQSGWILKMRKGIARQFLLGDKELFHGVEQDPILVKSGSPKGVLPAQVTGLHRTSSQKSDNGYLAPYNPLNPDETDETAHFRNLFSPSSGLEEGTQGQEGHAHRKSHSFFSSEAFRHRSLFIFGPQNRFRRTLQRFVTPGRGYRTEGERENILLSRPFNFLVTLAILACVIVGAMTGPVWRLKQFREPEEDRSIVIPITDYVFPAIFTVEFLIRVIADGFIFTPDAYLKTLWNKIDFFVLLTLYAPLVANLTDSQGVSRFFRSLKALRALRLINQSAYIKGTFHAVLVAGFPQLFNATLLSITLIIPFAIYGMRMFSGLFFFCNDDSDAIHSIYDCIGNYNTSDGLLVPRVWSNPHVYSFNNFGASFLILFEIVSQEGWTGVMNTARNVVGLGLQPSQDASRYNGIFFVIYNLAGGYFVSALFVAIVIENYTKRTGTAFMTANQRRWMDLKKLLGGIKMSKARSHPPANPIRSLFFQISSPKRGWFSRLLTVVTILDGILLATEHVNSGGWEGVKNWLFLALLSVFMLEIAFKIGGFGWHGYRKNRWNIYNCTVSICATLITVARLCGDTTQALIQTQKLFLTAILFRLVPRSDSLNQLFMTMAASIGSISSLFGVWLVVFAVYGIMFMEIFGLTTYGPNGSDHVNFRNVGNSLLMMARMSTGEGWNDLMHDFAVERPQCVNQPTNYLLSDCGSTGWSYTLFITFNIISMYIFTNMFIVVVMHNFSYVYQIAPGFSLITREEIRGFKRAWAEVDMEHTGYIQEKDLALFLMKLRGIFDVRIYNEEHSLTKLQSRLETVKPNAVNLSANDIEKKAAESNTRKVLMLNETSRRSTLNWDETRKEQYRSGDIISQQQPQEQQLHRPNLAHKIDQDYNLAAFNSAIANLDRQQVRRRRKIYNFLFTEAVMSMEPIPGSESRKKKTLFNWWRGSRASGREGLGDYEMGEIGGEMPEIHRGISFQKLLTVIAHYKLIEDDQCLSIGDLLRHRQKMDRIHARVNVMSVKSVLLKVVLRQRFLKHYRAVQRIRALAEDSARENNGDDNGTYGEGSGCGIGVGQTSTPIVRISHSSTSTDQIAGKNSPKRRVRIHTGETEDDNSVQETIGSDSSSHAGLQRPRVSSVQFEKTSFEEEESIDPEKAGTMIRDLRAQWRYFISSHDLSMPSSEEAQELDDSMPMSDIAGRQESFGLSTFENADNGSGIGGGSGDQSNVTGRGEILGVDYL
ncbi:calcium channel protein [Podila verticillata]|nr:calcium channel protein [Podila verticillata]